MIKRLMSPLPATTSRDLEPTANSADRNQSLPTGTANSADWNHVSVGPSWPDFIARKAACLNVAALFDVSALRSTWQRAHISHSRPVHVPLAICRSGASASKASDMSIPKKLGASVRQ